MNFEIPVGDYAVSAIRTSPEKEAGFTFVYAPGAGSNINDPFGKYLGSRLAAAGASLVRFQFPYMETGKRRPDRPVLLEATWREVIDRFERDSDRLVVGGRSMGGRIASQVVAKGTQVNALALFAYPLNPPSPDDLIAVAANMKNATVHKLDGADHSFAVLKSSSRTREDVWKEAVDVMLGWVNGF